MTAAEVGSLGRAATALGVTQSALSKRLKGLEALTNASLLSRSSQGVELTALGASLVGEARRVVEQVDALEARLLAVTPIGHPVRVAASPAIAERVVPATIALLEVGGLPLPIELLVTNSVGVRDAVAAGRVDIGIAAADLTEDLSTKARLLGEDELAVVVLPDDPWAELEAIPLDAFVSRRLVLRDANSHARQTLELAVASAGHVLQPALLEVGNPAAVKAGVRAAHAPGVLSAHAVDEDSEGLVVRPVEGLDLRRNFWVFLAPHAGVDARRIAEQLLGHLS